MLSIITAENMKLKRTFARKIAILSPIFTILLFLGLSAAAFQKGNLDWVDINQKGSLNVWYVMILPASLAIICAICIQKEKKGNYFGILSLPVKKGNIWLGKVIVCCEWFAISTLIMVIGLIIGGLVSPASLSIPQVIISCAVLYLTFLWQIPLCLFLTKKLGTFFALLAQMLLNIFGFAFVATTSNWYLYPFAIPSRLMCPIILVQPNGLPVENGSPLLNSDVILPGIGISISLFLGITIITMFFFQKQEG